MPFFSFRRDRNASVKPNASASSAESVEVVRKRARHRLIGASILILIAVLGFPLIFDSQPRPVPVDIAIEIPSRSTVKPGTPIVSPAPPQVAPAPAAPTAPTSPATSTQSAVPSPVPAQASLQAQEEILPKSSAAASVPSSADAPGPAPKVQASRTPAAPGGKQESAAASGSSRVVVQVGAYADPAKARETRQKLEKAGLKTYTQVVETKDGQRTRVRVGPYSSREEAEQVAAKIKALDLPASILAL
jgi:DedD protein